MARSRKSSKTDKEEVRLTASGLRHPYPAKPGEGKYVIYADTKKQDEDVPRVLVLIFAELYAAARFVNVLMGKDEYDKCEPVGSRTGILTSTGVRITAHRDIIKQILDFKPTEEEAAWRDDRVERSAMALRIGEQWHGKPQQEIVEQVEDEETGEVKTIKTKAKKEKKPPKEKRPKIDKSGMVTAGDLAARLKIEPRLFRGALRALKKEKPEGGWLWTKDEAEKIFKEISKKIDKRGKLKK